MNIHRKIFNRTLKKIFPVNFKTLPIYSILTYIKENDKTIFRISTIPYEKEIDIFIDVNHKKQNSILPPAA